MLLAIPIAHFLCKCAKDNLERQPSLKYFASVGRVSLAGLSIPKLRTVEVTFSLYLLLASIYYTSYWQS